MIAQSRRFPSCSALQVDLRAGDAYRGIEMWEDDEAEPDLEAVAAAAAAVRIAALELRDLIWSMRRGIRSRDQRRAVLARASAVLHHSQLCRLRRSTEQRVH